MTMGGSHTGDGGGPVPLTRRNALKVFGGAGATAALAGCLGGGDDGGSGSTVTMAPAAGPTTLDPHNHAETTTSTYLIHFYDGLVERNTEMELVPRLAEDWEQVDDTTWRFSLRDDVTFSNGEDFTAETAKYNLDRVSGNLEGAETVTVEGDYASIDSVEVVDDYTVQVNLAAPDPIFLEMQAALRIVPKEYTEENGFDALSDDPVGTGPYELDSWTRQQEMVMTARSDYFDGEPAVGELVWQPMPESSSRISALTTGSVDLIRSANPRNEEQIENSGDLSVERVPSARGAALWLNMWQEIPGGDEPVFHNNREARLAVQYATDIPSIIENILVGNGFEIHGWAYNDQYLGYNDSLDPYPHDPDRAEELLAEAGYSDGFSTTLLVPRGRYFKGVDTAEALATQLGDVGIDVSLDTPEFGTFATQTQEGEIPGMMLAAWGNPTFNPLDPYGNLVHPDGMFSLLPKQNQPSWVGELTSMIETAQQTADREELASQNQDIEALIHEQGVFRFLFQYRDVYGVNDRLEWDPRSDELVDMYPASLAE
ncbi:ABC transporter substrate-binding protein [Halovivax cerinus]|uniref:ABC transporter substrate-binding protein n=1 Tax=Halovivax cerinus TaxID=1487865 RepID=A0ABD5NQ36_9EURY|nr:ABC transporter substrate-binding protein [Halovivax cerinus]